MVNMKHYYKNCDYINKHLIMNIGEIPFLSKMEVQFSVPFDKKQKLEVKEETTIMYYAVLSAMYDLEPDLKFFKKGGQIATSLKVRYASSNKGFAFLRSIHSEKIKFLKISKNRKKIFCSLLIENSGFSKELPENLLEEIEQTELFLKVQYIFDKPLMVNQFKFIIG